MLMASRRWSWIASRAEAAAVVPIMPPLPGDTEEVVARWMGCRVLIDDSIPVNLGGGSNEDRIVVTRDDALLLREDPPQVVIDQQSTAGSPGVRLVLLEYAAFTAGRWAAGLAIIAGAGLSATAP